jgi:hypothetical protein
MAYCSAVAAVGTAGIAVNGSNKPVATSTSLDGVGLTSGSSRVLLTGQGTLGTPVPQSNGVWIYNGNGVAMSRPTAAGDPFVTGATLDNATLVPVAAGGLTWGGSKWWVNSPATGGITVDTTAITLVRENARPIQARLATKSAVTISNPGTSAFDGVTANVGDVILLLGQTATDNGPYVFNGSSSAMTRTADPIYPNIEILVNEGSTLLHTRWKLVTQAAGNIVLGTTGLTFAAQNLAVNVMDFGAAADDTTDDTGAINSAIMAAGASGARYGHVLVPDGTYRIEGTILIPAGIELELSAGATLHRHSADGTTPVVRLGGSDAVLRGTGLVQSDAASPRGVVCVGPATLTTSTTINNAKVSHVRIMGAGSGGVQISNVTSNSGIKITTSTAHGLSAGTEVVIDGVAGVPAANGGWIVASSPAPTSTTFVLLNSTFSGSYTSGGVVNGNVGLHADSSQPNKYYPGNTGGSGENYFCTAENVCIASVDTGVLKLDIVNGWHLESVMFTGITRYSFRDVNCSESSTHGGFTTSSGSALAIIEQESASYNHFYGVQSEPGGSSCQYYAIDSDSSWVQVYGHNNCPVGSTNAGDQCIIHSNGGDHTDTGTETFRVANGNVIMPPVSVPSGVYFTVKEDGNTPIYAQLGALSAGGYGVLLLGPVTSPSANNIVLASDGSSFLVVNAPSTGTGFLRGNNTSTAQWNANGLQVAGSPDFGGATGVLGFSVATQVPTSNPSTSGDGIVYESGADGGGLVHLSSQGVLETLGRLGAGTRDAQNQFFEKHCVVGKTSSVGGTVIANIAIPATTTSRLRGTVLGRVVTAGGSAVVFDYYAQEFVVLVTNSGGSDIRIFGGIQNVGTPQMSTSQASDTVALSTSGNNLVITVTQAGSGNTGAIDWQISVEAAHC